MSVWLVEFPLLGGSEEEEMENKQIFARKHTETSRNYHRKNYLTEDRRNSDPGSPTLKPRDDEEHSGRRASEVPKGRLDRPPSASPSRAGSRQGSKTLATPTAGSRQGSKNLATPTAGGSRTSSKQAPSRQGSKESDDDKGILPSGVWSATIQEGKGKKQKTRSEERHLHFNPGGAVGGSASFEGVVDGFVQRPHVEWTETYPWGSILVKLKYHRMEPWLLEGHFEASDGGTGVITLVHEQLKAAVAMAT